MRNEIPFGEIKELEDRSWTVRLANMIKDGDLECEEQIVSALGVLEDQRAEPILTQALVDKSQPIAVRLAALEALRYCPTFETKEQRAACWQSGDELLQRHAIRKAKKSECLLVERIAEEPNHPFYIDAISTLQCWSEITYTKLITKALRHESADVRECAANALFHEQPVDSELLLLECLQDESTDVIFAALSTLKFCCSVEIMQRLHELANTAPPELRERFRAAVEEVVEQILDEDAAATSDSYIGRYLKPVSDLLVLYRLEKSESSSSENDEETAPVEEELASDAATIMEDLGPLDQSWYPKNYKYNNYDWSTIPATDRAALCQFLTTHTFGFVRSWGVDASVLWKFEDAVVSLLKDPNRDVRQSAAYASRDVPRSDNLKRALWKCFSDPDSTGYLLTESLDSYIVHSPDENHEKLLLQLALEDDRPNLKYHCINNLKTKESLEKLLHLLDEPPFNTWAVHTSIIQQCLNLGVELPSLSYHVKSTTIGYKAHWR